MTDKKEQKAPFLVLLIIDGWGIARESVGSAFSLADTATFKELARKYPAAALKISLAAKKNISRGNNYFTIGTSSFSQKKSLSLADKLKEGGLKTMIISDQERYPEMNFFFAGRKKDAGSFCLTIKKNKAGKTTPFLTEELIKAVKKNMFQFIALSFSDLDLAAGRGDLKEAAAAAEEIDKSLKKIIKTILNRGGAAIITAAAGRAEAMINPQTELPNKKNSSNPVPFILVGEKFEGRTISFPEAPEGNLSLIEPAGDISGIAPTIMEILCPDNEKKSENKSFL